VGEFREVRWTWQSKDNDLRTGYLPMEGRISIADLITRMRETAPEVALEDIQVNWATVTWSRPANAEEMEQRRVANERWERRHEEWERKTLARLTEKYGAPTRCGSRGFAIGPGCRLPKGHAGPHTWAAEGGVDRG
jgi:hypothetical protein